MRKIMFYFLSWTWGLPLTLIGGIAALVFRVITGNKAKRHGYCTYTVVGGSRSGLNLGMFCFVGEKANQHTYNHEHGHAIQNCVLGPLMPIIITIPSAIRYWYRIYIQKTKGWAALKPYDSIWFEGQATNLGDSFMKGFYDGKNSDQIS